MAGTQRCPLCGNCGRTTQFARGDLLYGVAGVFRYSRCSACKSVYQDPCVLTEDLALCYPTEYYTHQDPTQEPPQPESRRLPALRDTIRQLVRAGVEAGASGKQRWLGSVLALSRRLRARAYFDLLDDLLPWGSSAARALDLGCGGGELLQQLARAGWAVQGLDIDAVAARIARERTRRPLVVGNVQAPPFARGSFDLIVMSHSFEHVPDMVGCLLRIRELLSERGRCVLIYPNIGSVGARSLNKWWLGWDPPRHLALPSQRGLRAIAARAGLEVTKLRTVTRWAETEFALSRAWRRGQRHGAPGRIERAMAALSVCTTRLGCGEEVVATLRAGSAGA